MIARLPLWPTLVVLLATLGMVRLGLWQLDRRHEKAQLLARYALNLDRPAVALPALLPLREDDLYRRTSAHCLRAVGWQIEAGRAAGDVTGWRHIALCPTGAEGPGLAVDLGVSQSPKPPAWNGGDVHGRLTERPTATPLIARLFGTVPPPSPMIVSDVGGPGLVPTAPPDPATVPNNHLSYAVQWFIFAALAPIIYLLALRRRGRPAAPPVARGEVRG